MFKKILILIGLIINTSLLFADSSAVSCAIAPQHDYNPMILLWLVIFIFLSRSLSIIKKIGIPLIVGEILTGIILGCLDDMGINIFYDIMNNEIMSFLAELGGIILMFEIGLESKFSDLKKNFHLGCVVAISGSILTFMVGFVVSKYLIPNHNLMRDLLLGVITAATATGISAKTFKDMNLLHTHEVQVVLVSSIIDELISVFIFGVISAIILNNTVSVLQISLSVAQVLAFFVFAAIFGNWITPLLTKWSIKIHAGMNMKLGVLLIICFLFSWIAYISGLATVLGAFIAGLILDEIYFVSFSRSHFFKNLVDLTKHIPHEGIKNEILQLITHQESKTLEELIKPLSHLFVPIFFIYIGFMLDIKILFEIHTLYLILVILIMSLGGRIISGFLVQRHNKSFNHLIIGLGMTPIGEAGLIFAMFGKNLNILDAITFAVIIACIVIATILTPIFIKLAIKFNKNEQYKIT